MPWVRVDDQFPDHPKVVAAGPAAAWLYVTALCYCNRMLTDGFIPDDQVPRLAPSGAKLAPRLVEVGLWRTATRQGIEGFEVHDYHVYQPTREEVMEDRRKAAQRQQRARERATQVRAARHGVSHGDVTATSRRDSRPRHDDVTVPPFPIPSTRSRSQNSVPSVPQPSTGYVVSSEPALTHRSEPAPGPPGGLLEFPTVGTRGATWTLTEAHVAEWHTAFPSTDILAEAQKARAWLTANPTRRKTARGMPRFLVAWLSRSVDNGRSQAGVPPGFSKAQAISHANQQVLERALVRAKEQG